MNALKHPLPEAVRNNDALLLTSPWVAPSALAGRIDRVMCENAGVAVKSRKLVKILDEAGSAIHPHTACTSGCSHCCHTNVMIFQVEAEEIASKTGRHLKRLPLRTPEEIRRLNLVEKYVNTPCPFLAEGRCTVYEVRPYPCRQAHSLNSSPDQCDTYKYQPGESNVGRFNLQYLSSAMGHLMLTARVPMGDIREFFPD